MHLRAIDSEMIFQRAKKNKKNGQIGSDRLPRVGFRQTAQVARATVRLRELLLWRKIFFGAKKTKKKMKTSEKGSRREVEAPSKGRAAPRPRWLSQVARSTPAAAATATAPRTKQQQRQRHLG